MNQETHILVITTNEYQESRSHEISIADFMDEAIEDQGGREAWQRLTELIGGDTPKDIDSDMIREYRAMTGLEAAMQAWLADEANRMRLALEAFYDDEDFSQWNVDADAVQAAYERELS